MDAQRLVEAGKCRESNRLSAIIKVSAEIKVSTGADRESRFDCDQSPTPGKVRVRLCDCYVTVMCDYVTFS